MTILEELAIYQRFSLAHAPVLPGTFSDGLFLFLFTFKVIFFLLTMIFLNLHIDSAHHIRKQPFMTLLHRYDKFTTVKNDVVELLDFNLIQI